MLGTFGKPEIRDEEPWYPYQVEGRQRGWVVGRNGMYAAVTSINGEEDTKGILVSFPTKKQAAEHMDALCRAK